MGGRSSRRALTLRHSSAATRREVSSDVVKAATSPSGASGSEIGRRPPDVVERQVDGDPEKPGPKGRLTAKLRQLLEDSHEGDLSQVFRIRFAPHIAETYQSPYGGLMPPNKSIEGGAIPCKKLGYERGIRVQLGGRRRYLFVHGQPASKEQAPSQRVGGKPLQGPPAPPFTARRHPSSQLAKGMGARLVVRCKPAEGRPGIAGSSWPRYAICSPSSDGWSVPVTTPMSKGAPRDVPVRGDETEGTMMIHDDSTKMVWRGAAGRGGARRRGGVGSPRLR